MTELDDTLASFEEAEARLEGIMAKARANSAHATRLAEVSRTATATAKSARGEVAVTARAGGVITRIELSSAAIDLGANTLEQVLVSTISQAQNAAQMVVVASAEEELGADSPLVQNLRAEAEQAFPDAKPGSISY